MPEAIALIPRAQNAVHFLREIISDAHEALRHRMDDLGPFASRDELQRALDQAGGEPDRFDPVSFLCGFIAGRDAGAVIDPSLPASAP